MAHIYSNGVEANALVTSQASDRQYSALADMRDALSGWWDAGYCLDAPERIPVGSLCYGPSQNIAYTRVEYRGIW